MIHDNHYKALVIGGSAGSMEVLMTILPSLPEHFKLPVVIVTHLHPDDDGGLIQVIKQNVFLEVKEAEDKEKIRPGVIYLPPANYHLLIEQDETFALSVDPKVNFSRPSIDVLFQSAAVAWGEKLIGILLTGASIDGSEGIRDIKKYGGFTVAQDPKDARYPIMPMSAVETGSVDYILGIDEIGAFLKQIALQKSQEG